MQFAQSLTSGSQLVDDFFDLKSLAVHLQKTPDQIRRLAERGQLPGRRVAGSWRFDRSEVFHWMEVHIGNAETGDLQQLERMLQPGGSPPLWLHELTGPDLVWPQFPSRTRHSVIQDMCQRAAGAGRLWDAPAMAAAIQAREEMHSTALDSGVALLHPRRPMPALFDEPFLALAIAPSGIPFGGPRGVMTDVFFLIASPNETFHLHLLSRLSRLISWPGAVGSLRQADSAGAVLSELARVENEMDGSDPPGSKRG